MEPKGPDIKKCEDLLLRCEKAITRALDTLRDIELELAHIIEYRRNHRYREEHE